NATLAEALEAVPLNPGARWTYQYRTDELRPARLVTHTVQSMEVVASETAALHIGTTGGPGFMPEWLLLNHGRLYVGTADDAVAWRNGRIPAPGELTPYTLLPPPGQRG